MDIANKLIEKILEKADLPLFVQVILLVIVVRALIIGYTLLHKGKGRKDYLNVIHHTYAEPYRERLQRFLDYTAKYWFKDYQSLDMKPRNHVFGTSIFTEPSFEFLLRLAIIYPFLAMYLVWLFTGNSGNFGVLEILSANNSASERVFITLSLFVIFHLFKVSTISTDWNTVAYFVIAVVAAVVASVGSAVSVTVGDINTSGVTFVILFIGCIIIYVVGGYGIAAVVGIVIGIGIGVVVGGGIGGIVVFAGGVIVVGAIIVGGGEVGVNAAWLYEQYVGTSKISLFWIGLYLFYILIFIGIFSILPRYIPINDKNSFSLLFFLGILPLLNAPLDWLSLGITRSLLYSITTRIHPTWKMVGMGFADFMIALIFLFLITLLTTFTIAVVNTIFMDSSGNIFINLPKIFDDLGKNGWNLNYYWLYFMFLSTLIPTAFHALIAVMSVVFFYRNKPYNTGHQAGRKNIISMIFQLF